MHDDDLPYDPREKAQEIARGHAYRKHVEERDQFSGRKDGKHGPELNIKAASEAESRILFAEHIYRTMMSPETFTFRGVNRETGSQTRDIYYNAGTNTTVVVNAQDPDGERVFILR